MRSFAFALVALILLSAVQCETVSWMTQEQVGEYIVCISKLKKPTCAYDTCLSAYNNYSLCIKCSSNKDSASAYIKCAKDCGSIFTSDGTAKSDSTVTAYVDGTNDCNAALNSSLLGLQALLIVILSLLF